MRQPVTMKKALQGLAQTWQRLYDIGVKQNNKTQ